MEFTLKIVFTGLMAFVPVDDGGEVVYEVGPGNQPPAVWALLVDAREPEPATDAVGREFQSHLAALRIREGEGSGRTLESPCPGSEGCRAYPYVLIDEESLVIEHSAGSMPPGLSLLTGLRVGALPCCTDGADPDCKDETRAERWCSGLAGAPAAREQMKDFNWLASLRDIVPGASIEPGLWGDSPSPGSIVARMRVESGDLGVLMMQHGGPGEPEEGAIWEQFRRSAMIDFDHSSVTFWPGGAIAKKMVLVIPGLEGHVTVRSTRLFGPGADPEPLVVRPPTGCGTKLIRDESRAPCQVVLELLNSPAEEIPGGEHSAGNFSKRHFELLWNLVADPPQPRPAPVARVSPLVDTTDLLCPEIRP